MTFGSERSDPALGDTLKLGLGVGGLALCLVLVFQGMRAVMGIGGACAEGGPYVPVQPCPDGVPAAMFLGTFGLFLFGAIGGYYGFKVGGFWRSVPFLAWCGLFGSLGWNFLDFGLLNPPPGESVEWGWLVPGIMFELMAIVPFLFIVWAGISASRSSGPRRTAAPGAGFAGPLRVPGASRTIRPNELSMATPVAPAPASAATRATRPALAGIDAAMGAALARAGETSTDAQLDRLERLAHMLEQGLLQPAEYETAKEAIMRELEARP